VEKRINGAGAVGAHKTSMLMDCEAGRPMEIDPLMSVVQEIGRLVKVDTPMIDAVLALIKLREAVNQGTAQPRPLTETQKAA
jgi:2-dehydropantoate 2-reductase